MTIAISESDYTQLWHKHRHQRFSKGYSSLPTTESEPQADTIDLCPPEFGRGFERWIELPGIDLLIIDRQFQTDLTIEYPASTHESYAEFGFNILGDWHDRSSGTNFLDLVVDQSYDGSTYQVSKGSRVLKVDIHLDPSQLFKSFLVDGFDQFPLELQQVVDGSSSEFYGDFDVNTPAIKLAIQQILTCPFQGLTRRFYLESKCLELIALKLAQFGSENLKSDTIAAFKSDDIDRIHQARNILIERVQHPPSLAELSRQVGLNDRKLKQGFRAVFGTTVFGYLHEYRMVTAMKSLAQGDTTIDQVVRSVGYASRSSFSRAFKQRFGASPRNYLA